MSILNTAVNWHERLKRARALLRLAKVTPASRAKNRPTANAYWALRRGLITKRQARALGVLGRVLYQVRGG